VSRSRRRERRRGQRATKAVRRGHPSDAGHARGRWGVATCRPPDGLHAATSSEAAVTTV
jgi:hypothetical protein